MINIDDIKPTVIYTTDEAAYLLGMRPEAFRGFARRKKLECVGESKPKQFLGYSIRLALGIYKAVEVVTPKQKKSKSKNTKNEIVNFKIKK